MNVVLYLFKALLSYENFRKYNGYIEEKFISDNSRELGKLWKVICLYHNQHPEKNLTVQDLEIFYYISYPATTAKDKELFEVFFKKLQEIEVKEELVRSFLSDHQKRVRAAEISLLAIEVADGKKTYQDLITLTNDLEKDEIVEETKNEFVTDDLESIYTKHYSGKGLAWRLQTLNKMLGPIRTGDFGFIFARPETGKTTILASEISYMASQSETPVIWFNNEQPGEVVKARIYQAYFGITTHELFKNRQRYQERYKAEVGKKILLYDSGNISRRDVERIVGKHSPSLCVFDQIDKIKGFENDREDLKLEHIYQWVRELSKKYCPMIGVCQAGATGEGKKWLEMTDVNGSKTGKEGEADFILGIGKSHQEGMEAIRHLHLCKNKLIGGELTIPELRHGKCEVLIRAEIARFEDLPERK